MNSRIDGGDKMSNGEISSDSYFTYKKPLELFGDEGPVKMCAPMVRYSKLAFRHLVRRYDCDLTFTPMIIANSFVRSLKARDSEFTSNSTDRPLIVQFAANNATDMANAAEIVANFADGVDLNCGCPQRWAMQEGLGACMIRKPELIHDIMHQVKNRLPRNDFTTSIKIRIHNDLRQTVDMCQKAERAGISWITVHARTPEQRGQPVNTEAIRIICDSVSIPVVANGDIKTMADVESVCEQTGVKGVMAAQGMLDNPAMYAGYSETPVECVKQWVDIALSHGTPFACFHHHLIQMMSGIMSKPEKRIFNALSSMASVLDYLKEYYDI